MIEENKDCWLINECNKIDCNSFCMRHFKLNYLYDAALISLQQRKHKCLRIDADETDMNEFSFLKKQEDDILNFVASGKNLYIHSQICGNGKTSWALRLVESFFNKIWIKSPLKCRALFISVPRFLLELKSNISQKSEYVEYIKANVNDADIVIFDDIATKAATSFEHEHLLSIIDTRISMGKSNIFTSNLTEEEMHTLLGDRLTSRIINNSINIELRGADKRSTSVVK